MSVLHVRSVVDVLVYWYLDVLLLQDVLKHKVGAHVPPRIRGRMLLESGLPSWKSIRITRMTQSYVCIPITFLTPSRRKCGLEPTDYQRGWCRHQRGWCWHQRGWCRHQRGRCRHQRGWCINCLAPSHNCFNWNFMNTTPGPKNVCQSVGYPTLLVSVWKATHSSLKTSKICYVGLFCKNKWAIFASVTRVWSHWHNSFLGLCVSPVRTSPPDDISLIAV